MPTNVEGLSKGRARYGTELKNAKKFKFTDAQGEHVEIEAPDEQTAWQKLAENFGYDSVMAMKRALDVKLENAVVKGAPEHGTIKDYSGKVVFTFFSPEHLVRWMAQNGFGDIKDLEQKGLKFVPVDVGNAVSKSDYMAALKQFAKIKGKDINDMSSQDLLELAVAAGYSAEEHAKHSTDFIMNPKFQNSREAGLKRGAQAYNGYSKAEAEQLFEEYAKQFSEDEMMEGENWIPQKIANWLRGRGVTDQGRINYIIGCFRDELSGV